MQELAAQIGMPVWFAYALGALVIFDLSMRIVALVQLLKTPAERVSMGGHRWIWALVILLLNWIGWILWFGIGRKPASAPEAAAASTTDMRSAADKLYADQGIDEGRAGTGESL